MQYRGYNRNVSVAIITVHYFQYHPTLHYITKNHLRIYVATAQVSSNPYYAISYY